MYVCVCVLCSVLKTLMSSEWTSRDYCLMTYSQYQQRSLSTASASSTTSGTTGGTTSAISGTSGHSGVCVKRKPPASGSADVTTSPSLKIARYSTFPSSVFFYLTALFSV